MEASSCGAERVITFSPPAEFPEYRIVNRCRRLQLVIMQRGCMRQELLAPGTSMPYAWEEPAAPRAQLKVVLKVQREHDSDVELGSFRLAKVKQWDPIELPHEGVRGRVVVRTHLDGPTKVLTIHHARHRLPVTEPPM